MAEVRHSQNHRPVIVWFHRDLRTRDNPALSHAAGLGEPVIPVFVWSPEDEGAWRPGRGARWWVSRSLERLDADLAQLGAPLVILDGAVPEVLEQLVRETGARTVVWNRRYEPAWIAVEARLETSLGRNGVETRSFEASRLTAGPVLNSTGLTFRRFTPFFRAFLEREDVAHPVDPPVSLRPFPGEVVQEARSQILARIDAELEPADDGWCPAAWWEPGAAAADAALSAFLDQRLAGYTEGHDHLGRPGTSRLSPYLSFGEISSREVWYRVMVSVEAEGRRNFLRQLIWREFAQDQIRAFPGIPDSPFLKEFEALPVKCDERLFEAWKRGLTGYPVVDAGMRELAATGWMHNRARMVTASFLIKHLGLPWQWGEHWFWDRLVDADLANNSLNWQWVAGSAADASPYYRIFNPERQGARFDPQGEYVRRWVPELRAIPGPGIHRPRDDRWSDLGYPEPVVEHEAARRAALDRYAVVRELRRSAARQS